MKESGSYLAEVLRYDVAADSWFPAGTLTEARRSFAVALLTDDTCTSPTNGGWSPSQGISVHILFLWF